MTKQTPDEAEAVLDALRDDPRPAELADHLARGGNLPPVYVFLAGFVADQLKPPRPLCASAVQPTKD